MRIDRAEEMGTEMTEQERLYRFHWRCGTVQEARGRSPAHALNRLGYGGGAVQRAAMSKYAEREPATLEPHYSEHVNALTAEKLHEKSAIAAELAYRDKRIADLEAAIQSAYEDAQRGVIEQRIGYDETPCSECRGLGTKVYGSTATWRGGIGGQMITDDVCDRCWGSGDADKPWPSWRKSDAELGDALKAARGDKLFQELEHRYMTVCADLDRLRSENGVLWERLKTAREAADEIAWAVRDIPYVAGFNKLLDATELVLPETAWAKDAAAHVSTRPDASLVVSPETADRHTQEGAAEPKESSDE